MKAEDKYSEEAREHILKVWRSCLNKDSGIDYSRLLLILLTLGYPSTTLFMSQDKVQKKLGEYNTENMQAWEKLPEQKRIQVSLECLDIAPTPILRLSLVDKIRHILFHNLILTYDLFWEPPTPKHSKVVRI